MRPVSNKEASSELEKEGTGNLKGLQGWAGKPGKRTFKRRSTLDEVPPVR